MCSMKFLSETESLTFSVQAPQGIVLSLSVSSRLSRQTNLLVDLKTFSLTVSRSPGSLGQKHKTNPSSQSTSPYLEQLTLSALKLTPRIVALKTWRLLQSSSAMQITSHGAISSICSIENTSILSGGKVTGTACGIRLSGSSDLLQATLMAVASNGMAVVMLEDGTQLAIPFFDIRFPEEDRPAPSTWIGKTVFWTVNPIPSLQKVRMIVIGQDGGSLVVQPPVSHRDEIMGDSILLHPSWVSLASIE